MHSMIVVLGSSKLRPLKLRLKAPWSVCLHTRVSQQPVEPSPPVLRRSPAAAGESKPGVVHLRPHQQQALKSAASVPTSALVQFFMSGSGYFGALHGFLLSWDFCLPMEVSSTSADFTCPQAKCTPLHFVYSSF